MSSLNPQLAIIVAMSTNRVIGIDNELPWHLPEDLKHFKQKTLGKPVVMGRKTFESIGRPLPERKNIVITRDAAWSAEGVEVVNSVDDAITIASQHALAESVSEVMLIGGAMIYEQVLPLVSKLYITEVKSIIEGDAYFPEVDLKQWLESHRESHISEAQNLSYDFVEYIRPTVD